MPALVVGAVTVSGAIAAPKTVLEAVDRDRAVDNSLLATLLGTAKGQWAIQVTNRPAAQFSAILAALAAIPPITCSGDLLGGTVSCHAEVHGTDTVLGTNPRLFNLSFTLHQV